MLPNLSWNESEAEPINTAQHLVNFGVIEVIKYQNLMLRDLHSAGGL